MQMKTVSIEVGVLYGCSKFLMEKKQKFTCFDHKHAPNGHLIENLTFMTTISYLHSWTPTSKEKSDLGQKKILHPMGCVCVCFLKAKMREFSIGWCRNFDRKSQPSKSGGVSWGYSKNTTLRPMTIFAPKKNLLGPGNVDWKMYKKSRRCQKKKGSRIWVSKWKGWKAKWISDLEKIRVGAVPDCFDEKNFLEKNTAEPRQKKTYFPLNPDCLIRILIIVYYNPPHNWVVFHPLYTLNNQGPFFHCSHVESRVSKHCILDIEIPWVWPPLSNSDHQIYYIFSRESQPKPLFPNVTGRGPHPNPNVIPTSPISLPGNGIFGHGRPLLNGHPGIPQRSLPERWIFVPLNG